MVSERSITPVILAGGRGTRLRPLTSETRPKPFLKVFSKHTLFQKTVRRVSNLNNSIVVCDHRFSGLVRDNLQAIKTDPNRIICEPVGRSTAPAIALAAFMLRDTDQYMLVMPSDHYMCPNVIANPAPQGESIQPAVDDQGWIAASPVALRNDDEILIFGAKPTGPKARYGYIQVDEHGRVTRFIEKPDRKTAKALLEQGNIFWNTGIFLTRPAYFLDQLRDHAPDVFQACEVGYKKGRQDEVFFMPDRAAYAACPSIAVDYAVMEHVGHARVVPIPGVWHDVGTWPDLVRVYVKHKFLPLRH